MAVTTMRKPRRQRVGDNPLKRPNGVLWSIFAVAVLVSVYGNTRGQFYRDSPHHDHDHHRPTDDNYTFSEDTPSASRLSSQSVNKLQQQPQHTEASYSLLTDMLHLQRTLPNTTWTKSPPPFRELSYAVSRKRIIPRDHITLTTQISVGKLDRLRYLLERWNGPISCAVYVPNTKAIYEFNEFCEQSSAVFQDYVTFHVYLERPKPDSEYPINRLRNLALHGIDTDFFFSCDVDFMPRANAHSHLIKSLIGRRNNIRKFSKLYVLPAFEVWEKDNRRASPAIDRVPKTKEELLQMLPTNELQPFHYDYYSKGHNATNYEKWYTCKPGSTYPITYEWKFEPYVVGNRYGVPNFCDRFRGFGLNKLTWAAEAHLVGYEFEVLCDHFVVHMNHPGRDDRRSKNAEQTKWYQSSYLPGRYNYTLPGVEAARKALQRKKRQSGGKKVVKKEVESLGWDKLIRDWREREQNQEDEEQEGADSNSDRDEEEEEVEEEDMEDDEEEERGDEDEEQELEQ